MKKPDKMARQRSIVDLEDDTIAKVGKTISLIEIAISAWEGSKEKPESFKKRIDYLRSSRSLLSSWAKKSLTGKKDSTSVSYRLMDFVEVCKVLENSRVA